jgi:hypothetical protein
VIILLRDSGAVSRWTHYQGFMSANGSFDLLQLGAICSVLLSLVSQVGEQVDQVRFLPAAQPGKSWKWWCGVIAAGPGWIVIGAVKIMLGSFLAVLAYENGFGTELAVEPTHMYGGLQLRHQFIFNDAGTDRDLCGALPAEN